MVKVVFHNLEKSNLVRGVVTDLVESTLSKFPRTERAHVDIFVSMENSPVHAGPDQFSVKLVMSQKGMKPIILTKSAENLYQAASLVSDRLLEALHRAFEKRRERRRESARHFKDANLRLAESQSSWDTAS